jgi:hypothetical protein
MAASSIWLEITITGTNAMKDSIRGASVISAPGPVETTRGAGLPVTRA